MTKREEEEAAGPTERGMSRRRFIGAGAAASASLAAVMGPYAVANGQALGDAKAAAPTDAQAQAQSTAPQGYVFFTPFQADIISAAAGRLIPADDNGPGAIEAGVVFFIDRQLASLEGFGGQRYSLGPFVQGTATQGDQSAMSVQDRYRLGIAGMDTYAQQQFGKTFAILTTDQQDQVLKDMEAGKPDTFDGASIQTVSTQPAPSGVELAGRHPSDANLTLGAKAFFGLLLSHVIAGFFADPVHGGNQDLIGWKLIGFPGAQMSYRDQITQYGVPWTGGFKSLADYQGQYSIHPTTPPQASAPQAAATAPAVPPAQTPRGSN
jgi:gluconate 2-dehydrogenase gamma chain